MDLSKTVAYNTLIQIFAKSVSLIFGITTTAILTNYLGASGFGDYTFALSVVAIFSSISDWGTTMIAVKEASRDEENQSQIFGNVLILRLALSIFAMFVVWALAIVFPFNSSNPGELRHLVFLASFLIVIFALKTSLEIVFQARLKMDRMALTEFIASLLTLVFAFVVSKTNANLDFLILTLSLANMVAILGAIFMIRDLVGLNFKLSKNILKRMVIETLPMGGVLILYSVYNRLDTVILELLKGSQTVGVYGLAYRVYEVLVLGAFYLMNTMLPILSKEKDQAQLNKIYQKILDLLILIGLTVFIGTLIFAPLAIKVIAFRKAQEFALSIPLLQILGLAAFVSSLNHLTGYTIVVLGKQRSYLFVALTALFFNLIANIILIPYFSSFASAWITVLTEGLVFVLTFTLVSKTMKFTPSFFSFPRTLFQIIKQKGKIF